MGTLDLVLKKKWYDMIESGIKTEEYREITSYWASRLLYPITLSAKHYWQEALARAFALVKENPRCFNLPNLLIHNYGLADTIILSFIMGTPRIDRQWHLLLKV